MRPLKFHPILKQTLWGGERIIPYKELASELSRVGESWELSGMPGSESVVAEGPWTGSTLPELIGRFGAELLGKANYARFGQEFPLLVKFIDAREDLSIQVHPDDELARKRHGKSGKCEMWYVLEAEPGASLLTGFSRPIAPAEYERRVADNTLTDVLNRQAIASGDVFYLPAGRVHSIGKGSFIVEIQQSKKGGRITPAAAALGTLLKLKPVLQIQGEKLDSFAKARTVKQAKKMMIDAMRNDFDHRFNDPEGKNMYLEMAYTHNLEDAEAFKKEVEAEFPGMEIVLNPLSLSVSCHIGPGALAVACSKKIPELLE